MSLDQLYSELDNMYRDNAGNFQNTRELKDRIGTCMDLANGAGARDIRDRLVGLLNTLSQNPQEAGVVLENIRLQTLQLMRVAA